MAKKKSNKSKGQQRPPLSPDRFMREKARFLPLGKCYVYPSNWQDCGAANIFVTRVRPNGNLVMSSFMVDTFCLGVKNAFYYENLEPELFEDNLRRINEGMGVEEISYDEAHNIIYGAIEFAEEAGIPPAKTFNPAGGILEEDTDDVPLIEYDFGKNGKHCLIVGPDRKEVPYIRILQKNLGDNFDFVMPLGEDFDDLDEDCGDEDSDWLSDMDPDTLEAMKEALQKMKEEAELYPDEEYSYQYPHYPMSLSVKNQFIVGEIFSPDNFICLPHKTIDRILALPKDEAAEDIAKAMLYEIGRTYKAINDNRIEGVDESVIMHSLLLLTRLQSEKGLGAVLEVMRQNNEFTDCHIGIDAMELLSQALYACGQNNIPAIEAYLNEPGLSSYIRWRAYDALAMIVVNHPERRSEIIEVFRRILVNMTANLPVRKACDASLVGFLMLTLEDISAKELIPEIKNVFATDCVNKAIAGDWDEVVNEINSDYEVRDLDKYLVIDIYEYYEQIKQNMTDSE